MTIEEIREDLITLPIDINGEFKNPLKLVKSEKIFNDCVWFWKGLERSNGLGSHIGTLQDVDISKLKSIQWGIKAEKVERLLGSDNVDDPVVVLKTKEGLVLLDGNTRVFIKQKLGSKTVKAFVIEIKIGEQGSRLFESVLDENESFYGMVASELHDQKVSSVYSDEPLGSNYSCFDYNHEGDDGRDEENTEKDRRFVWRDCHVRFDDDGIYVESKSGKNMCVSAYAIAKAELSPSKVKLWVAPKDSSDEMGVVEFYK
jgi:hypothetical protein